MKISVDEPNDVTVSAEWLAARLAAEDLVVVDVSWYQTHEARDAEAEFLAEHIPGAVPISLDALADRSSPLPNTLPTLDALCAVLGRYGIDRQSAVICYDATGFRTAPRLWWLLKWAGHDRVAILDGGLPAWKAAGFAVEAGATQRHPARFAADAGGKMPIATADAIARSIESGGPQVVDSRPRDRFDGLAPEPRAGLRRGHIPGSVCAELKRFVDPQTNRLLSADAAARVLAELGVDIGRPIVATCGSGVAATGLIAILERLGVSATLYDGSWSEWGSRADLPVSSASDLDLKMTPGGDRMTDTDLTRRMATWACEQRFDNLGSETVEQLERLLIDHLACACGGAYLPWGRGLVNWAAPYAGTGESQVIGSTMRTSAPIAAFLNATAAHGMELDDTHDASLSHPGAAVMATALAVGADTNATGEDILTAMAVGYEMTCRAGMATGASILEFGFHPTALFGGFGACAVAARLYGLDRQGLEDAWGLLLSMIGGSAQFSQDPRGTVVKRLHGGFGAKNGILAAQLARQGLSGPSRALDGRFGLLSLFGQGDSLPEKLDPDDGAPLAVHRISLKPYPCCRLFHSTIDAAREILGELPYSDIDAIDAIHVGGPNVLPEQHMIRRPTSMMAAQYSLPYSMAAAFESGPYDIGAFDEESLAHPVREAIADKVTCVADATMQAAFPEHFGTWIDIRFVDGSSKRVDKLDSYGTPSAPMSIADIVGKADGLLTSTPLEMTGEALADAVSAFVQTRRLRPLIDRLAGRDD